MNKVDSPHMSIEDFKIGVSFLYQYTAEEISITANRILGIGEIIETDIEEDAVHIKWVWCPSSNDCTIDEWYRRAIIKTVWIHRCKIITEQEKLSLLLKHTFG